MITFLISVNTNYKKHLSSSVNSVFKLLNLFITLVLAMEIDRFVEVMSSKMAAQDIDENIRQTFMAFDSQCKSISFC